MERILTTIVSTNPAHAYADVDELYCVCIRYLGKKKVRGLRG
jgi:hypothetical protein